MLLPVGNDGKQPGQMLIWKEEPGLCETMEESFERLDDLSARLFFRRAELSHYFCFR